MAKDKITLLADYQVPAFRIESINLTLHLDPQATQVVSSMQIARVDANDKQPLVLDGVKLKLKQVVLNDITLDANQYQVDDISLTIFDFPAVATVRILTEIDPLNNTALEGLYMSNGRYFTQCESQGFRCITYYLDRPDVLAKFTTTVHGDRDAIPYCLSNGNLIAEGINEDTNTHWFTWENPYPMPSYLFACVGGEFSEISDNFITQSGRHIRLRMFAEPRNANKCDHALKALKLAMRWDEVNYGREYDLDNYMICAVDDFNSGAMENKGLNIFNSECVLANVDTATDTDFQYIEAVVGHEYFHNWTGNRVTCRDWFQLCLKEGLTMFREQQFMATVATPVQQRIADVRVLRTRQFAEDAGPMAHPVRPDSYQQIRNFYTSTVYNKGAEIYRMLWNLLGAQAFRHGMDQYFEKFDGQAVTIDRFVENMQEATGKDLTQFHLWYSQAGTPSVTVTSDYDAQQKSLRLTFTQHTPATPGQQVKKPLQIPFALGLLDSQGNDIPLQCQDESLVVSPGVIELTRAEQCVQLLNVTDKPYLSLLRGFSAPVKVDYAYSAEELLFLWQYDSDDFNRWDAAQQYLTRQCFHAIDNKQFDKVLTEQAQYVISQLLKNETINPALLAELITVPSESYLILQRTPVDLDKIICVRDSLKREISHACNALLLARYQQYANHNNPKASHERHLQNVCLDYLLCIPNERHVDLCVHQYESAVNMTNRMAALRGLTQLDRPERTAKLAHFYATYQDDPIVVNKWLSVQAQSSLPSALADIKALISHPGFSMKNPNKVRALIGTFSQQNCRTFHQFDGEGYALLADIVLTLNVLNPQMAARIVGPLVHWRRYIGVRGDLMKAQLMRISSAPMLSNDVGEIVGKALQ